MNNSYRLVCALALAGLGLLGATRARAEGSKELTANGGYRPWLMYRNANETSTVVQRRTVTVGAGQTSRDNYE